jgi:transcriptional regulator with XRE-family HTH domain
MLKSTITGKEFKSWRESHGWSRIWLANKIGVAQSSLWKWEKDDVLVPLVVTLASLALAYKLNPTEIKE